ncbi:reticulon-4b isoform X1 [Megalobrama amblycephala]|uniref:reticulon-4b isoform X1 n=1 Tax=Megalobrama amblycephala TaxID=75352 RepID=UPI00201463E3|nr:reticulon-4b isoform X1 [Megalobrama amblycephala]
MEESDKVSSTAPDEAPHDAALNEAAAGGQTRTDARNEEEMTEKTGSPQTTEVTSTSQTTEVTSSPQITEETSTSQTTEETKVSTSQITEVTNNVSPQTTEKTGAPQRAEETNVSSPQTTEVTSTSQTNEETSAPQITEETSAPQTTEETKVSTSQTTEVTNSPPITEETSTSQISEETSAPQTAEVTNNVTPQITEVTSTPQITEETSISQTTENTSAPQIAEEISAPPRAEDTSPPQITELTSPPEPAEESAAPAEGKRGSTEAEVTSTSQTDEVIAAEATEETSPQQTEAREDSVTPPASAARVTPAAEVSSSCAAQTVSESRRDLSSEAPEEEEEAHPHTLHPSPSHDPEPSAAPAVAPALFQPPFPSDHWDSPSVASQATTDLTMDSLGHKDSAGLDPDVLSQSDDDFMSEMKKSLLQAFSPLNDGLGERSVEVSDSPSPDLVQDAYDGDDVHAQTREIQQEAGVDAALSLSYASDVNTMSDDRPTSLPDILKSSPMNPEKEDSGSSEESPDFSPVHRSVNESANSPFSVSANSLLEFDSKILLLKEMTEVTEAKAAEKAKLEAEKNSEQSFAAFDLVKETDVPAKSDGLLKDKDGVEVLSQTSVKTTSKFEHLNFPSGKAQEHWDSESPSADSFSPVLDAVTQKPLSFTAEQERRAADEASEQEVSSEEFEFVERPPQGAVEEFLEMQDSLTFVKPSEVLLDEDRSPEPEDPAPVANQSSYHLLNQASDKSSAARGKAGLESDFQDTPVICPPADKAGAGKQEAEGEEGSQMSDLRAAAVLDLLHWRDVKSSALVFGSSLFVLLSLTCCSIISVLSYAALALLSVTVTFRIYKGVLQAIQKSDEGHPFKWFLEKDVALSREAVQKHSDVALSRINGVLKELRRLFLVEDLVDSLKFAVLLWIFTHVGSWFNGLTLLILGLVGAFSGPIIYEKHQTQIDQFISTVSGQMKGVLGKIQAKVPGAKKKPE